MVPGAAGPGPGAQFGGGGGAGRRAARGRAGTARWATAAAAGLSERSAGRGRRGGRPSSALPPSEPMRLRSWGGCAAPFAGSGGRCCPYGLDFPAAITSG